MMVLASLIMSDSSPMPGRSTDRRSIVITLPVGLAMAKALCESKRPLSTSAKAMNM